MQRLAFDMSGGPKGAKRPLVRRSMDGLDAMRHYVQCFGLGVVLDDLHLARDEMCVVSCVANGQCFALAFMLCLKDEEDLPIARGRQVKEVHGLVPHGDFRAWHVAADSEVVGLALDEGRRLFATKIEPMGLL